MRVLLASNASYDPPRGGSTRSNLAWLRGLAASGHRCRVISASVGGDAESERDGISIRAVRNFVQNAAALAGEIRSFDPDWVLVSSEDLTHVLLEQAGRAAPHRLVYLAHTPQWFPFGPESWNRNSRAAGVVREARAVVTIGEHMAGYVERHLGARARVIHPPIYGDGTPELCGGFEARSVLMINPCAVKGIGIFLELARRFPKLEFAGLAGWGTTAADRAAMSALPNVRILETVPRIEDALSEARILLMPSLWYEGFGLIAMEAMLRGLPVVASDSGGLLEAKRGTNYVIRVKPVERYLPEFDDVLMPKPVVPEQDLEPWAAALSELTESEGAWRAESARSREAGLAFTARLDAGAFGAMLGELEPARDELTPAQRALLLERLMRRKAP